jgi:hypothetical protein
MPASFTSMDSESQNRAKGNPSRFNALENRSSLFLNAENILDIRQTKYESLLRPQRANDGRWTVDAWAPLSGFTVNGGVRVKFGA